MMNERRLIPCLYLYKGQAVSGWDRQALFASGDVKELVLYYSSQGADGLLIYDLSSGDADHEEAIGKIKKICEISEIPVTAAGSIRRMEDVKKLIYAGCAKTVLNFDREDNRAILEEVSARFGREKILVRISDPEQFLGDRERIERYASGILADEELTEKLVKNSHIPITIHSRSEDERGVMAVLKNPVSVTGPYVSRRDVDLGVFKDACKDSGIPVRIYQSKIPWNEFKLNSDGMIPVIVQDYRTDEVLMLAYMNDEAYEATIRTGKMTYWSRSRDALWVKGQTSGHFQYVKSLSLDCDNDTILAKVDQVGAACHTGNRSCFFQELMKKEYDDTNPLRVFQNVFNVILDRKVHPKEGSYTNYLFDKGIDKILKKVGEECTEIVIAAKNPDKEEIKYEISDFLYHVMVLMAEKGVTWEDITEELARR